MDRSALILGVAGILLCVFGWVIYRLGLRAVGFLSGALFGTFVATGLCTLPAAAGHEGLVTLLGAALFGVLGLALAGTFHYLLSFIGGAVAGVAVKKLFDGELDLLLDRAAGVAGTITYDWGDLVAAVIGGLLFMAASRYFIIAVTSAVGGAMVSAAFGLRWLMPVAAAGGVLVQLFAMRGFGVRPEEPRPSRRGSLAGP